MRVFDRTSFVALTLALGACVDGSLPEDGDTDSVDQDVMTDGGGQSLAVFVLDNSVTRNAVVGYHRDRTTGLLERAGVFPTGGKGTGAGLGSQGAIVLDSEGSHLFAVNPGSDEISVFEVRESALVLRDIVDSGGANPISVTVRDDLLYVLNAGRGAIAGSIAGFQLGDESMAPIPGSIQPLSAAAVAPAQIALAPNVDVVVVTEKATNSITTYVLDAAGAASAPIVTPSHGQTPFGFAFDSAGHMIVTEAFGGAPGASAVSSYALDAGGIPTVISGSVPNGQGAACWIAIGADRTAYATNTASNTVSGFRIKASGELVAFADGGVTATTGATPTDADFNAAGRLLYVLDAGADAIDIYARQSTGALVSVGQVTGLPAPAVGMAAR